MTGRASFTRQLVLAALGGVGGAAIGLWLAARADLPADPHGLVGIAAGAAVGFLLAYGAAWLGAPRDDPAAEAAPAAAPSPLGQRPKVSADERADVASAAAADEPAEIEALLAESRRLAADGRARAALAAAKEAADLCVGLAEREPERHRPTLAAALDDLAARLVGLDRHREAGAALAASAGIWRDLAAHLSGRYRLEQGRTLIALSRIQAQAGEAELALASADEAVSTLRLAAGDLGPEAAAPLAEALAWITPLLVAAGRKALASDLGRSGLDLMRMLPPESRAGLGTAHAALAAIVGELQAAAGEESEGLAATEEAAAVYRTLATTEPAAYGPTLAATLQTLARRLAAGKRTDDALAAAREAVDLRRQTSGHAAGDGRADVAWSRAADLAAALTTLANMAAVAGDHETALAASAEALATLTPLYHARPRTHAAAVSATISLYQRTCRALDRAPDAGLLDAMRSEPVAAAR